MGLRNRTQLTDYNCFFVTTTCKDHLHIFKGENYIKILYGSLLFVNKKYDAEIVAYVFMPNHIHLILFFKNKMKLSEYMRDFKKFTSVAIRKLVEEDNRTELLKELRFEHREQKLKVWEDRFDDLFLITKKVLLIKLNYIHNNPVEKGWVAKPYQFKHSSASFYFNQTKPIIPILHYGEIT